MNKRLIKRVRREAVRNGYRLKGSDKWNWKITSAEGTVLRRFENLSDVQEAIEEGLWEKLH